MSQAGDHCRQRSAFDRVRARSGLATPGNFSLKTVRFRPAQPPAGGKSAGEGRNEERWTSRSTTCPLSFRSHKTAAGGRKVEGRTRLPKADGPPKGDETRGRGGRAGCHHSAWRDGDGGRVWEDGRSGSCESTMLGGDAGARRFRVPASITIVSTDEFRPRPWAMPQKGLPVLSEPGDDQLYRNADKPGVSPNKRQFAQILPFDVIEGGSAGGLRVCQTCVGFDSSGHRRWRSGLWAGFSVGHCLRANVRAGSRWFGHWIFPSRKPPAPAYCQKAPSNRKTWLPLLSHPKTVMATTSCRGRKPKLVAARG